MKMHSIPAPETQEEWEPRFNRKTNSKIQKYNECGFRFNGDKYVLEYIERNRRLLKNRPQCFQHGDYHVGNMMIENGELKIIDFDRYDFGDPWEEFNRIVWSAATSPYFATGQLRGYFDGEPPIEFFKLLAFYIASNTLSSIYWAVPFGQSDLDMMMKQAQDVLEWFDNMKNPMPTWYLKEWNNSYVSVIKHYDSYIDDINDPLQYKVVDPAQDTKPIREYMDKWDGEPFTNAMQLAPDKFVLEIGVGTGRLAERVCGKSGCLTGIDISPKTIERARENLRGFTNINLIYGDFLTYSFNEKFDTIYSSLTFMHIQNKRAAIQKVENLLIPGGRFVLSIDKNQQTEIDYGSRKITVYPDTAEEITALIAETGLIIEKQFETEFAVIFVARKGLK
jgi:SAM-dependent methyltransferase